MDKNIDETLLMLNTYNKDAKEGDCWYENETAIAVYNGEEWVAVTMPVTLKDLRDLEKKAEEADQLLYYDAEAKMEMAPSEFAFTSVEPSYDFNIFHEGETLISMDVRTGEVTFGENYTLDKASRVFWESVALMSPYLQNEEELQKQYAAMQADCDEQYAQDNDHAYALGHDLDYGPMDPLTFEYTEPEVEYPLERDPFEDARGVIE